MPEQPHDIAFWGIFAKLKDLSIYEGRPGDLYGDTLADFYDRFVGDFIADVPVFEELLTPGGKVLDLACGAGRIGIPLARLGFRVDGVELSPEMLALANKRLLEEAPEVRNRLSFVAGDMSDFDLPTRYDLILVGVTSISLLLTAEQRHGLFRSVRRHLAPGGCFIFDILDLSGDRWRALDNYLDVWSSETDEGTDYAIVGQRFFPKERLFSFNVYREQVGWDGTTTRVIGNSVKAWLDREQLVTELSANNLAIIDEFDRNSVKYFVVRPVGGEAS